MRKFFLTCMPVFIFMCMFTSVIVPMPVSASVLSTFYVSPTGNDTNPGTQSQPFQTIEKAQTAVRAINSNMTGDIEVILMGGTYNLTSTLIFTSQDSGTSGFNVIYKANTGSTPIISGGTTVTEWTLHDAGNTIYKANVGTSLDTRQLYVDGVRAVRARGEDNPGINIATETTGTPPVTRTIGYTTPSTGFYSNMEAWGNVSNIEIVSENDWERFRFGVSSISGTSITAKPLGFNAIKDSRKPTSAAWVENAYELLDSDGEWYLDRTSGYLYYKPRTGENMASSSIVAATLETLVSGAGTVDNPVEHITLDGITFSYNTWLMPNGDYSYPDNQAGVVVFSQVDANNHKFVTPAGVTFSSAKNVTVQNCTFTHMGNAGLNMDKGSQNNKIDHNYFSDLSGNGINIGGVHPDIDHHPTDPRYIVKDNMVSHNMITNIGVEYADNVGIFVGFTEGTVITHNTLYNLPYTGISIGFGWGAVDQFGPTIAKNNRISHNLIHDYLKVKKDGGAIYTLGIQQGSQIYNNYMYGQKNSNAYIYLDNGSEGFYTTNNVTSNLNSVNSTWYMTNSGYTPDFLNSHYNDAFYNYYSSGMSTRKTGGTNVVANNYAVDNNAWDTTAQAIIDNAGVDGGDGPAPLSRYQSIYEFEGFENGLMNWVPEAGNAAISTTKAHSGSYSYVLDDDTDVIRQKFESNYNKVVSLWFYDDSSDLSMQTLANVTSSGYRAIGVNTPTSLQNYVVRVDDTYTITQKERTTGWHEFTWDYRSGTKVDLYIDRILVSSPTGVTNFNTINFGDWWGNGTTGPVYFDDVSITDVLQPPTSPVFTDGFELGFSNWTTVSGTASTSTYVQHGGSNSYEVNQDIDVIQHSMGATTNQVGVVWFYDNADDNTLRTSAFVDKGTSSTPVGMGVDTLTTTDYYVYRVGSSNTPTTIDRTTGWHSLAFDYRSGTDVKLYLDGIHVTTSTAQTGFNVIRLGDYWGSGETGPVYFDDISVQSELPKPTPFTPPASANLKLWLSADAGISTDVNGKVSAWADQSGNTNNAIQNTAVYQPTFVNNVINGNPVIRFDGANDSLLSSGVTGNMNTNTVIFVLRPQAVTNYNQTIQATGGWGQFVFQSTSTGQVYTGTSTSSRITPTDGPGANTLVANNWSKFAYVFNSGSAKLFKNGTQLASKRLSNPASWTGFSLGLNNVNTINGDIAEVFVYNSALSDADRQSIDAYLLSKYGF
ncbi:LamG-like jellyroll fold domain-containing protein [Bacillus sp. FJAT-28004]|uniref:LamG-like jellyroll fold domain-containing protein n=1 Tax=Bacillus sp. FJAT-28004 TaxID=1679165 RepID=UPI0006B6605E|nr:LamG-like jellyroll fold domain-containing protein [Bacillus sp. FJAT-28004]